MDGDAVRARAEGRNADVILSPNISIKYSYDFIINISRCK